MVEFIFWTVMALGIAKLSHLLLKFLDWIEGGSK